MRRWMCAAAGVATVLAVACGSDVSSPNTSGPLSSRGSSGATDSTGGNNGGQTSSGTVKTMTITPATASLGLGYYTGFVAVGYDASGTRVAKRPSWKSSNDAVAPVVGDTGVVFGKALGTATITATIDGVSAQATVTVVPSSGNGGGTPTPPVSQFSLTVVAYGSVAGPDTAHTERVAGVTVKLTRLGGVTGDTLATPIDAGSAVADANGEAHFTNLAGGTYLVHVIPSASSPYKDMTTGFGPPRQASLTINASLARK